MWSVLICIIVLLVLVALGVGCYQMWRPGTTTENISRCSDGNVTVTVDDRQNKLNTVRLAKQSKVPSVKLNHKSNGHLGIHSMNVEERKSQYQKARQSNSHLQMKSDRDATNKFKNTNSIEWRDMFCSDLKEIEERKKKNVIAMQKSCPLMITANPNMDPADYY